MGATQSKKRRKERKRKRRNQYGGPSSAHFDVPRSVSLDALRSHCVTSPSSATAGCPHCGGWSWDHQGGRWERRTFSGLLETSGVCHGFHRCLRGQYDDMQGSGSQLRGYDSDDDAARWSYHVSCPACSLGMSEDDMTSCPSAQEQGLACPGPEHSTMSLNRHMGLRVNSKIAQSRSSEFAELLDMLRRHEEIRTRQSESATLHPHAPRNPRSASSPSTGKTPFPLNLPDQSNRVAISSATPNTVEAPALVPSNTKSPSPPPTKTMEQSELPLTADDEGTKSTPLTTIPSCPTAPTVVTVSPPSPPVGPVLTTNPKKPITVLEDEETRLARWEKQKLMAEQFRLLRKHLLAREATLKGTKDTGSVSEPLPLSLKGPLDAVESYLSSQSNSNSSMKSGDLNSSRLYNSSVQSLPGTSPKSNQVSSRALSVHSALPHSALQYFKNRDEETVAKNEANSKTVTSSFAFSSSTRRKTVRTLSCSTADKTNFSSSERSQSVSMSTSSQSQTSHGRSKFSRQGQNFRNLDNHPVLSRLQNEQNSRLERMERKMRCIRASAEQAAERKKFEQIFPARQEVLVEDERQRMKEAEETLVKLKEENKRIKQMRKASRKENTGSKETVNVPEVPVSEQAETSFDAKDSRSTDDSGEVIPVHVLPWHDTEPSSSGSLLEWRNGRKKTRSKTDDSGSEENQPQESGKKPHWLNSTFSKINMDLGELHPLRTRILVGPMTFWIIE